MKTIEVTVTMGLVGCRQQTTFEIEDDASDDDIEEAAREAMFELIQWTWRPSQQALATKGRKR